MRKEKKKNTLEEWNNNKPISTHRGLSAHPPEFTSFTPAPQAIRPSPRAKKKKKMPVFEDAWREGLCSGHRITGGVTGLDTSVRCYSLTHILTGPFWLEQVSGNQRSAAHWYVCRLMSRESFRYGWLWLCLLVKGSNWKSKTEISQDFKTPEVNVITLICLKRLFFSCDNFQKWCYV